MIVTNHCSKVLVGPEHSNIRSNYFKLNITGLKIPTDRRQAIYKCGRGVELRVTVKQLQVLVRVELQRDSLRISSRVPLPPCHTASIFCISLMSHLQFKYMITSYIRLHLVNIIPTHKWHMSSWLSSSVE